MLASAFVAKAVLGISTTSGLIERLAIDRALRRICGFSMWKQLPSESTFSRAFAEFAGAGLAERTHAALVKETLGEQLIGHISRDGTAIELMDAAYCSSVLREHSRSLGHVPLIDHNPRKGEKIEFTLSEAQRYKERSQAERINARLKDDYGGRYVQVRGNAKVMSHLMFGILALTANQLMRLLT